MYTPADFLASKSVVQFLESPREDGRREVLDRLRSCGDAQPPRSVQTTASAIELVLRDGELQPSQVALLQFLRALVVYTEHLGASDGPTHLISESDSKPAHGAGPVVIDWVLSKVDDKQSSAGDDGQACDSRSLMDCLFELIEATRVETLPTVSAGDLASLRRRAFHDEPLRVFLVLLRQKRFQLSSDSAAAAAECALTTMLAENIGLSAADLLQRVKTHFSQPGAKAPPDQQLDEAIEFVKSIKSLARITEDAEHAAYLYNKNCRSVRQVAQTIKAVFVANLADPKMTETTLLRIHDTAERVDCWNESLWLELIKTSRENFIPIVPRPVKERTAKPGGPPNNLTDMFVLEDRTCDPCYSVTSLSAYFADLMNLLQTTRPIRDSKSLLGILSKRRPDLEKLELSASNSQTLVPYISLVNEVLESFIRHNEAASLPPLGSANVRLLSKDVSSDDAIISYTNPSDMVAGGDSPEETRPDDVYRPATTDESVYALVAQQMFPFTSFPYNRARDAINQYLAVLETSMPELLEVFAAPELLLREVEEETDPALRCRLERGANEVLKRQLAAESLGLQQAEFAAITGETFYPAWLAETLTGLSGASSNSRVAVVDSKCQWDASALWGYSTKDAERASTATPAECMLQTDHELGLSSIKGQLMRRTGLRFQDILDIAKTQCYGQHLVITNQTGSKDFNGGLEELRLLSSAADPPFKPLTQELCFALQSFLRLQARLGWSTKQLDATIFCLRNKEVEAALGAAQTGGSLAGDVCLRSELPSISPFVITNIASLQKLSDLIDIEATSLLPLWGSIDSFGDNSLLHRKFLTPEVRAVDPTFSSPGNGRYFTEAIKSPIQGSRLRKLNEHFGGLSACLSWPVEFLDDLLEITNLEVEDLTVSTLSILYRNVLICRMLEVEPSQATRFLPLFFSTQQGDPLASPSATLHAVSQWKTALDAGWTIESLVSVLLGSAAKDGSASSGAVMGLRTAAAILDGAREVRKSLSLAATGSAGAQDVVDYAARTFDHDRAARVVKFVEGTQTFSATVTAADRADLQTLIEESRNWPKKIKVTLDLAGPAQGSFKAVISLTGILTDTERQLVDSTISNTKNEDIKKSLGYLVEQSLSAWTLIESRFGTNVEGKKRVEESILKLGWDSNSADTIPDAESKVTAAPEDSEPGDALEAARVRDELHVRQRRKAFAALASPTVTEELIETLVITTINELVPDLDVSLLSILLSRVIQVPALDGSSTESAMSALQHLNELRGPIPDGQAANASLGSYFTPSTNDVFTIKCVGKIPSSGAKLSVNGLDIPFDNDAKAFDALSMTGGQSYLLVSNMPATELKWSNRKVLESPFTEKTLMPLAVVQRAATIEAAILRVASICQTVRLTADELAYISMPKKSSVLDVNLNKPTLQHLVQLQKYRALRDATAQNKPANTLVNLFTWLGSATDKNSNNDNNNSNGEYSTSLGQLAAKIAQGTGWGEVRVKSALEAKYPRLSDSQRVDAVRSLDALVSLQSIMRLDAQFARLTGAASQPTMSMLFDLASPRSTLSADDTGAARALETRLTPRQRAAAADVLMQSQRRALVAYLLQQPYVRNDTAGGGLGITDADGLFEHFLIDVQMGPQLRTSRVKQAVSCIQLFAQRCLLGLEEARGVDKNCLVRDKWEWMQQYAPWEARRRLFLYPENWLDPALRDTKSELFARLEASLNQRDLSPASFLDAVRTYVYELNGIASLEVVAYLLEQKPDSVDVYHIFGRSRTAPHTMYYRTLTVKRSEGGAGSASDVLWRPWTQILVDVPSVESEWDGSRLARTGVYLLPVMRGGRLYLFMPQMTLKTVEQKPAKQSEKVTTFDDIRKGSTAGKPQITWEVTMAWTEFVRGTWAPKRMSPGSLTLSSSTAGQLPKAEEFRIDPVTDGNGLSLLVSYGLATKNGIPVGRFLFSDDQIGPVSGKWQTVGPGADTPDSWAPARPLATSFQMATIEADASSKFYTDVALAVGPNKAAVDSQASRTRNILLWVPPALDALVRNPVAIQQAERPVSLTWTLSPNSIRPGADTNSLSEWAEGSGGPYTALALSTTRADGTAASYFNVPESSPVSTWWGPAKLRDNMDLAVLNHGFSHELMRAAASSVAPLQAIYDALAAAGARRGTEVWGARRAVAPHELGQPMAVYNWELGLHAVLLGVDRFFATQQFDAALEVARLVFDPTEDVEVRRLLQRDETTVDGKPITKDKRVVSLASARAQEVLSPKEAAAAQAKASLVSQTTKSCWRFPPFQDIAERIDSQRGEGPVDMDTMNALLQPAIMERRSSGALVHATARGRPEAYMKWIVMKYVEILVASGDVHFRKGTLESLPLAIQRYVEAAHVLGPEPPQVPLLTKRRGRGLTFAELSKDDVQFELDAPFSAELRRRDDGDDVPENATASKDADRKKERVVCFLKTKYFGVPMNPRFKQIRALVNERLFNIRNGLDIQGRPVTYSLLEPLIDPGALMALEKGGFSGTSDPLAMVIGDRDSPVPRQRFDILVHRALELCSELRGLGERMLVAVEKREGDAFAAARAGHATLIRRMMLGIKETQLEEARQSLEALEMNRETQVSQLAYYLALIGEPESRIPASAKEAWIDIEQVVDPPTDDDLRMSRHEKEEFDQATWTAALNGIAQGMDTLVTPFFLVPDVDANASPMGVGATTKVGGGSKIAKTMQTVAHTARMAAMITGELGSRAARKAQMTRQLQERRLQANLRGREIKAIDKQIEIQRTRERASLKELDQYQAEIDEAAQIEAWYRTKYANEQLYGWMEKGLRALYYQAYALALATARRAESALAFEQGRGSGSLALLRPGGYWDMSRDGLLAADHLYLDLKRLEAAQLEGSRHDFEVTKTVSLRQIDPQALLRLRATGSTTFSLGETLFDMDFPGHYMRRIRCVAVSIPAVLGPHAGLNATLTLLQHRYRVSPNAATPAEYMAAANSSVDGAGGNVQQEVSQTPAFRTDRVPITSVALSTGAHDAGVFELNFAAPRYVPFEGAGAISTWRLELPTEVRRFDYESIGDVLFHLQYTALDGGACLRAAAGGAVRAVMRAGTESEGARESGLWAMFDLRNDFVNEWHGFRTRLTAAAAQTKAGADQKPIEAPTMQLGNIRDRLPFWARQEEGIEVRGVTLVGKNKALVDSLVVSATQGAAQDPAAAAAEAAISPWHIRSWNKPSIVSPSLSTWTITGKPEATMGSGDNVYMLLRYVLGKKKKAR